MYGVLDTHSEYTYLYKSKNITSYNFLLVFKDRRKPSVNPQRGIKLKVDPVV